MKLKQFQCDPKDVRQLKEILPQMYTEISTIFGLVWQEMPTRKYRFNEEEPLLLTRLAYPQSGYNDFYGLKKHLMPVPSYFVLYRPLR